MSEPKKNATDKGDEEIIGVLTTCVVRSKMVKNEKHYTIDLKLQSNEPSDAMFKLEGKLKKLVGLKIVTKQMTFEDKY